MDDKRVAGTFTGRNRDTERRHGETPHLLLATGLAVRVRELGLALSQDIGLCAARAEHVTFRDECFAPADLLRATLRQLLRLVYSSVWLHKPRPFVGVQFLGGHPGRAVHVLGVGVHVRRDGHGQRHRRRNGVHATSRGTADAEQRARRAGNARHVGGPQAAPDVLGHVWIQAHERRGLFVRRRLGGGRWQYLAQGLVLRPPPALTRFCANVDAPSTLWTLRRARARRHSSARHALVSARRHPSSARIPASLRLNSD